MSTFTSSEESTLLPLLKAPTDNKLIQLKSVGATTPTRIDNNATTNYNKWGLLTSDDEEYLSLMKKISTNETRTNDGICDFPDTKLSTSSTFESDLSSSPPPQVQSQKLMQPQQLDAFFHPGNLKDTKLAGDSKMKRRKYTKKPVKNNMNLLKFLGMPEPAEFDGKVTLRIGKANASLIQSKFEKSTFAGHVKLKIGKANAIYVENRLTQHSKASDLKGVEIKEGPSMDEADSLQSHDQHQEQSIQLPDSRSDGIQPNQNDFGLNQQSQFLELEPSLISSAFNQQLPILRTQQQPTVLFSEQQEPVLESKNQQTISVPLSKESINHVSLQPPEFPQIDYPKELIIDQQKTIYNAQSTESVFEKAQTNKAIDNLFQMSNDAVEQKMPDIHQSSKKLENIHPSILDQHLRDNYCKESCFEPSPDQATLKPEFTCLDEQIPTTVLGNQPNTNTTGEISAIAITNDSRKREMVVSFKYRKPPSYIVKLKYKSNQQDFTTLASTEATTLPLADLTSQTKTIADIVKPEPAKKPIHPFFLKRTESRKPTPSFVKEVIDLTPSSLLQYTSTPFKPKKELSPAPWPTSETMHVYDKFYLAQEPPLSSGSSFLKVKGKGISKPMDISDAEFVVNKSLDQIYYQKLLQENPSVTSPASFSYTKPSSILFTKAHLMNCATSMIQVPQHLSILEPLIKCIGDFSVHERPFLWTSKYAPLLGSHVMTGGDNGARVTAWLKDKFEELKRLPAVPPPGKGNKKKNGFKNFFAPSQDYDNDYTEEWFESQQTPLFQEQPSKQMSKYLILNGPAGSGKTSAVYAAAAELGAYTFELNPSDKRSSKRLFEKLGGMGKSHLVHKENDYKQKSVILFDEIDVLFEDDNTFWSGLDKFVETSRRPVIMTCSNPSLLPDNMYTKQSECFIEFGHASLDLQVDALWLIALCEFHFLEKKAIRQLLLHNQLDFRSSLNDLQFWCQNGMAQLNTELTLGNNLSYNNEAAKETTVGAFTSKFKGFHSSNKVDFSSLTDTSLSNLDIYTTPPLDTSLSDLCALTESFSDSDLLRTNTFTEYHTCFQEEYNQDRILGMSEVKELPHSHEPYLGELCIHPTITSLALTSLTSPSGNVTKVHDTALGFYTLKTSTLRKSLAFLTDRRPWTSSASYSCVETGSATTLATELCPTVRTIARRDAYRESENSRLQTEIEGPASRRKLKYMLAEQGIEIRRYLRGGDLHEILLTAPPSWALQI